MKCGKSDHPGEWFLSKKERKKAGPAAALRKATCKRCAGTGFEPASRKSDATAQASSAASASGAQPARPNKVKAAATRTRNRWSKKNVRNGAFVEWLLGKLPARPDLVLDIAGGNGKVGALLALQHGVPCVIVDPAKVGLSQRTTRDLIVLARQRRTEGSPDVAAAAAAALGSPDVATAPGPAAGDHSIILEPCAAWLHAKGIAEAGPWPSPEAEAAAVADGVAVLAAAGLRHIRAPFTAAFPTEHPLLWARASVLCGMHPDEATDAIVDLALAADKPLAVVPCCVFPRLFDQRVLRTNVAPGQPTSGVGEWRLVKVRSYEDYLLWLRAKDAGAIVQEELDIPGRSTVLFRIDSRAAAA